MSANKMNWPMVRLGDICCFHYGKALPADLRAGGDVSVFGSNGVVGRHNKALSRGPTIVIGRKGSYGEINFSSNPCWPIDTAYFIDESATDQDIRWLGYRLEVLGLNQMNRSAAVPGLNREDAYRVELKLPPISEQRYIATILDQADVLRAQRREALAQLDRLTQAIFIEMFGDELKYPQKKLSEICSLITDGTHYTPIYADKGVVFLSAKNVTSGHIDWGSIKYIPEKLHQELQKRVSPKMGDVLLAKNGTTGVAAIVERDCIFDIYVSLALLRPIEGVLSKYLHAAINSPLAKRQFNAALRGIGVPNLHLKDIRQATVPLPPQSLQQTFATRIQAVEALKATHRAALAELDALFASLQHRAFTGAL